MNFSDIENTFKTVGGEFISSPILISKKLKKIKVLVFDWDGVWHSGKKRGDGQSSFSEVDSMGLNMLRFGYYLQNLEIPKTVIITGENNKTAFDFAEREHLDAVFFKAKNKAESLDFVLQKWNLKDEEVLFVFDDILDLSVATRCGVGYLIHNTGNPLFIKHVLQKKWCDYKSAATGETNAVREICELSLGLLGKFEETLVKRMNFDADYKTYWEKRNTGKTLFFTPDGNFIAQVEKP